MADIERRKADRTMTDQAVAVAEAMEAMLMGMGVPVPMSEYAMQIALACSAARTHDTMEAAQARLALMARNMEGMLPDIWKARARMEREAAEAGAAGHA